MRFVSFLKDVRGNTALLFALGMIPMLGAVGLAVDYGRISFAKTSADAAADAAVLQALRTAQNLYDSKPSQWKSFAQKAGKDLFAVDLKAKNIVTFAEPDIEIERDGYVFSARLTYDIDYPTTIMQLFSTDIVKIANTVTASSGAGNFISVNLVIDNSSSMGIGATPADQQIMIDNVVTPTVAEPCAFACHIGQASNLKQVRDAKAKIRIDIVKEAAKAFLDKVKAQYSDDKQVEISIHTFANDIKTVLTPTTDIDKAIMSIDAIDLIDEFGQGGTLIENSLGQLRDKISNGGDGSTPGKRKSYVIVLTDGVEDNDIAAESATKGITDWSKYEKDPRFNLRTSQSFVESPSGFALQLPLKEYCTGLKQDGHTLLMTRIAYLLPMNARVSDAGRLNFIMNEIEPNADEVFKDCASQRDYAFYAADSNEVAPAFDKILDVIQRTAALRLTQ